MLATHPGWATGSSLLAIRRQAPGELLDFELYIRSRNQRVPGGGLPFLAIEVLFRVAHEEIKRKQSYCIGSLMNTGDRLQLKLFFASFRIVSFRGQMSHAQIGLLLGFNSTFPTSIPVTFIRESRPGR